MAKIKLHTDVADEATIGTTRYPVDQNGNVEVDAEGSESLMRIGGFTEVVDPPEVPDGMVEVIGQPGTSVSQGEDTYTAGDDGRVMIPLALFPTVGAHGFTLVPEPGEPCPT